MARALALAQRRAAEWGADPRRFILMGHSAGGHLVAVLAAAPQLATQAGALPWLGTVCLDSSAIDTMGVMERRHPRLYDNAFGSDPAYWRSVSPVHLLAKPGAPFLAVCSTMRHASCLAARGFANKASLLGMRATVLEQHLAHGAINEQVGAPGAYTDAMDRWIDSIL